MTKSTELEQLFKLTSGRHAWIFAKKQPKIEVCMHMAPTESVLFQEKKHELLEISG